MQEQEQIQVTDSELYYLAAEMVMENMPLTNKEFNPKDKDECVDMLQAIVAKKGLTIDWIKSVATANFSNVHCFIDCDEKWVWNYLGGLSRATHTREDFLKRVTEAQQAIQSGNYTVKDSRKGYGKNYFNKKK